MMDMDKYFPLKSDSTPPLNTYLGGNVSKFVLTNGVKDHILSSIKNVKKSVKNVEDHLDKQGMRILYTTFTKLMS